MVLGVVARVRGMYAFLWRGPNVTAFLLIIAS